MPRRLRALVAIATVVALAVGVTFGAADAHADDPLAAARFALELSGVRYGLVKVEDRGAAAGAARHLVFVAPELTTPLLALVKTFAHGKAVKNDVRLSSGAVVRKAKDAQLVSVRLPALGVGGSADVELAFLSPALSSQPLLSVQDASRVAAQSSPRISGFRVEIASMLAIEAPKLDAIMLAQKPGGAATAGEIAFEVAAGGAPPFVQWQKASAARSAPRTARVEYLGAEGSSLLRLELDRCALASVKPMGASGTTRITLACAGVSAE